jgi:hypothetical protein
MCIVRFSFLMELEHNYSGDDLLAVAGNDASVLDYPEDLASDVATPRVDDRVEIRPRLWQQSSQGLGPCIYNVRHRGWVKKCVRSNGRTCGPLTFLVVYATLCTEFLCAIDLLLGTRCYPDVCA